MSDFLLNATLSDSVILAGRATFGLTPRCEPMSLVYHLCIIVSHVTQTQDIGYDSGDSQWPLVS